MVSAGEELLPEREGVPFRHDGWPCCGGAMSSRGEAGRLGRRIVQNDFDAGATRTVIDFREGALACEGDGSPFDRKGWRRLESVLGAGGDVEAKKHGIGSKNHGLRSVFLLADRIGVQSGGLRADLTVRGDRKKPNKFKPAFWPRIRDPCAPDHGTRVTAPTGPSR
jgi:hypothetical protein